MKGDFTRDGFDRAHHYSAVLLEQGGLLTDSDWKEQADLVHHRIEAETLDVIGSSGGPMNSAAFKLIPGSQPRAIETDFGSPAHLWIAADDGYVFQTLDGGATWTAIDTGTTRHLHALRFVGSTGWAVGAQGTVLVSIDSGANWATLPAASGADLYGVAAVGAANAWAVGEGGTVLSTVDGGASWSRVTAGATQLNGVAFQSASRGIAVGNVGAIFITVNGGLTWQERASSVTAALLAIVSADASNAWAVGERGTILKSADGGETWVPQVSGTTHRLTAVSFSSPTAGVAVGEAGTLLGTTDGGATWNSIATAFTEGALGVVLDGDAVWTILSLTASSKTGAPRLGVRSTSFSTGTLMTEKELPGVGFSLSAGRYYVGGTLCEVEAPVSYYAQPDRGPVPRLAAGEYLIYVQVWQRLLCAIEAPSIREVALGEADPSTRAKTVWQVKALPLPSASSPGWNCFSSVPELDALAWPPAAKLSAQSDPHLQATSLCDIGATAGYRRLENQLYRVEIQQGGATPRFKWSRENGSVAFGIESIGVPSSTSPVETVVRLRSRGRDQNLELSTGDCVEIVNDDLALEERVGPLFQFLRDGSDRMEIVLAGSVAATLASDPSRHPLLRRWDHPTTAEDSVSLVEGIWIELEDGVQIRFEAGGAYRPGDYWLIPARTVTGDVEWPRDSSGTPLPQPPHGTEVRTCRLGLISVDASGAVKVTADCRNLFPPLTQLDQLLYVSGDGQQGLPGQVLAQPLTVRVARGPLPVQGAAVRFKIESGAGTIVGAPTGTPNPPVLTNSSGVAECEWILDADLAVAARHQTLSAHLLDEAGSVVLGTGVVFSATAAFSLVQIGGDGQQAAPGAALEQPLEVRVANHQVPFEGVEIQFSVASGGGTITSPSSATTSALGIASATWQLGSSGTQRIEAQLLDGVGTVIQHVAFNATIDTQSKGGCAVTVGEGGDVPELDSESLRGLLEKHSGQVCICFLAGQHKVDGLRVNGEGKFRISIHGCGHTSRLIVRESWALESFDSIQISNVSFDITGVENLIFKACNDVALSELDVREASDGRVNPLLHFLTVGRARIANTRVQLRGKTLSLMFDNGESTIDICNCDIEGIICFYGHPGVSQLPLPILDVNLLVGHFDNITLAGRTGRLRLFSNRLDVIAMGENIAGRLRSVAGGAPAEVEDVMIDALLVGNSFDLSASQFVAQVMVLSSNTFMAGNSEEGSVAVFVAGRATVLGNTARNNDAVLHVLGGDIQKAANGVTVLPP